MAGWSCLVAELDRWTVPAKLWWRDDDAIEDTAALRRLMMVRGAAPIGLAVIPAFAKPELAKFIMAHHDVAVLQHGWAHQNHAPVGQKKAEVGAHRPIEEVLSDIERGHARLSGLFGKQLSPIFVPPWNRFAEGLEARLIASGYRYLSAFKDRRSPDFLNTHVDVLDWAYKKTAGHAKFAGETAVLEALVSSLERRRQALDTHNTMLGLEPSGLLTHHLDHDEDTWDFLGELVRVLDAHPMAEWINVADEDW